MTRVLEQEVNLSRRACWKTLDLEKSNSNSKQNLNREKYSDDNECCYVRYIAARINLPDDKYFLFSRWFHMQNYHSVNSSHISAGHCNRTSLFRKLSQFFSDRITMLAFMKENMMLSRKKKHLIIFMVLLNVLLLHCGSVDARPNATTNSIHGSDAPSVSPQLPCPPASTLFTFPFFLRSSHHTRCPPINQTTI